MKGQIKVTAKDDSGERKGVRREREGMDCGLMRTWKEIILRGRKEGMGRQGRGERERK